MPIRIVGRPRDITEALDRFPYAYHNDFRQVQHLRHTYLTGVEVTDAAMNLASGVRRALSSWGAGRRRAPKLRDQAAVAEALASPALRNALIALQSDRLYRMTRDSELQSCGRTRASCGTRESDLFSALSYLNRAMFDGNTNVTYPMKALLLLTGLMPAFDSQVRRGLRRAGVSGMASTQYLMPSDTTTAAWKKISRLPILLERCWEEYREKIGDGVIKSDHRYLIQEPGRVFDIVLFMQARQRFPLILDYRGPRRWYVPKDIVAEHSAAADGPQRQAFCKEEEQNARH